VILANFTQDFSMSPLSSIQYFAVCAMGAMATALLGIKLKSYIAKRKWSREGARKGRRADKMLNPGGHFLTIVPELYRVEILHPGST